MRHVRLLPLPDGQGEVTQFLRVRQGEVTTTAGEAVAELEPISALELLPTDSLKGLDADGEPFEVEGVHTDISGTSIPDGWSRLP